MARNSKGIELSGEVIRVFHALSFCLRRRISAQRTCRANKPAHEKVLLPCEGRRAIRKLANLRIFGINICYALGV